MWVVFAVLSAVFAALTSILAKVGIDGVNSNLATAIRTVVVLAMAWGMVFITNTQSGITSIDKMSVVITLVLAFVFLHEKFTIKSVIGSVLIAAGTLVMVL